MTISHELLQSSLDDARRQIVNLEATVERQKQEISSKETQLGVISGRVSTLMKSFEVFSDTYFLSYSHSKKTPNI